MKSSIIFLLCLLSSFAAFNQDRQVYKYKYQVRGEDYKDTSSFRVDTLENELDTSVVDVAVRNKMHTEVYATILIRDAQGNIVQRSLGVEKGNYWLKPGTYRVMIVALGYLSETVTISVSPKQHIKLDVLMARGANMSIYDVYSKEKLTKAQLDEIRACIKKNGPVNCGRKGNYYILLEI